MLPQRFRFGLNRKNVGPEKFRFLDARDVSEGSVRNDIIYES